MLWLGRVRSVRSASRWQCETSLTRTRTEARAREARLETLGAKAEALGEREEALTARDEAKRLEEAASRVKEERKNSNG